MSAQVLAVVVCYNPNCEVLLRALSLLQEQGCELVVIDNASSNIEQLQSAVSGLENTQILAQSRNLGLGAAHNIGLQHARTRGLPYALLMDQDSVPLDGMVSALVSAHQAKSKQSKVSAVGVTYLNADNGSESFFVRFGALKFSRHYCGSKDRDGCVAADFLISSGSLVALSDIDAIGDMDETLFIDHVDTEWFLRAQQKGYQAYGVCAAVMQHGLGENTHRVTLGGRQRNVPQHKPFRYYYIFRNSVLLYKRGYTSWLWKWNDLQRLGMIMIMFGVLKAPRRANLKMMLRGLWDGLRGRAGALDLDTVEGEHV